MTLLPLAEALERVAARSRALPPERVPFEEAAGRILAEAVRAPGDLPASDISMMDGYALRAADATSPLRVAFEVAAGDAPPRALAQGEAARIFTGAPLPAGADCVVMQEHAARSGAEVRFEAPPRAGQHIRRRGEEVLKGAPVLDAGATLGPAELSLLVACGVASPLVGRRPRVALLPTGDELVPPLTEPLPGKLVETNSIALAALVRDAGGVPLRLGIAPDRTEEIAARLGAARADVLVTTGGASIGDHDHAQAALERIGGALVFHTVAIRPGKPALFGTASEGRLLFGLPGNPAAAMLCFELFIRPALRRMLGDPRPDRALVRAELRGAALSRLAGLTYFPRGVLRAEGGRLFFTPGGQQSSMQIGSWAGANAAARIEPGAGKIEPGEPIDVLLVGPLAY